MDRNVDVTVTFRVRIPADWSPEHARAFIEMLTPRGLRQDITTMGMFGGISPAVLSRHFAVPEFTEKP